jgi:hypothetical protein
MTFVRSILATTLFTLLLLVIYYLHIAFIRVDVVFYAAVADGILSAALTAALLHWHPYFSVLNRLEKAQLCAIFLLTGYAFAISVPTVIDRSLSMYILEKLQQRGGGIRADRFEDVFVNEYMHEFRLVDVRLTEQEQSGTVVIKNGCVLLTAKGRWIASVSSYFRQHLLPGKRLLRGEYTDALVDPLKNSISSPDYQCK